MLPSKTRISMCIRAVKSESVMGALWVAKEIMTTQTVRGGSSTSGNGVHMYKGS